MLEDDVAWRLGSVISNCESVRKAESGDGFLSTADLSFVLGMKFGLELDEIDDGS